MTVDTTVVLATGGVALLATGGVELLAVVTVSVLLTVVCVVAAFMPPPITLESAAGGVDTFLKAGVAATETAAEDTTAGALNLLVELDTTALVTFWRTSLADVREGTLLVTVD